MNEETTNPTPAEAQEPPPAEAPKRRLRLPLILGIVCAVLAAVLIALLLSDKDSGDTSPVNSVIHAYHSDDEDHVAYIPMMDGTVIRIDNAASAAITADRQTIVVKDCDGIIYYTDTAQSEKHIVADNVLYIDTITDDGLVYVTEETSEYYRVLFADSSIAELAKNYNDRNYAPDTLAVLLRRDDGIYILPPDSSEEIKVSDCAEGVTLEGISNDGTAAIWTESNTDRTYTVVFYENGERTEFNGFTPSASYKWVSASRDTTLAVVCRVICDSYWVIWPDKNITRVTLDGVSEDYIYAYTENGPLSQQSASEASSLYLSDGYTLYYINSRGKATAVVSDIFLLLELDNGFLVYRDTDDNLCYGELHGSRLTGLKKIAMENFFCFTVSENGEYIYITKKDENDIDSLYSHKVGTDELKKVGALPMYIDGNHGIYRLSSDGETVIYMNDTEYITGTQLECGALWRWNYNSGESELIADGVISRGISSGGTFDPDSFVFYQYDHYTTDTLELTGWYNAVGNLYYYNGEESVELVRGVSVGYW